MNRDDRDPGRVQLTITQVLAGALAAMVGSLVASRLGVAGTVIGAAVISVVATVLTAINVNSVTHVRERAREARMVAARARLQGTSDGPEAAAVPRATQGVPPPSSSDVSDQQSALWEIAEIEAEEAQEATAEHGRFTVADRRGYHWGVIAGVSVLVFVLAMVGITVVEKITGQAIACSFGRDCDDQTTIPLPGRNPKPSKTPSPSVEPTPSDSATVEPTPTPTPTPTSSSTPEPTPSVSGGSEAANQSPAPGASAS